MSELTTEHLLKTMRDLHEKYPPPPPSPFAGLFRPMFCGEKLFEAPDPPPLIQLRDIQFADGSSILSADFRAKLNGWLLDRFGRQEDMFKNSLYFISGLGIVGSKRNIGVIRNITA